jgi:hypothetical protein
MAVVIEHSQRTQRLREIEAMVTAVRRKSETLARYETALINEGQSVATINTDIQAQLTAMADDITAIRTGLNNISTVHRALVKAGMPPLNAGLQLIKCDNGYSVLQPKDSSNWSGAFAANDVVKLASCEESANDGIYQVSLIGYGSTQAELIQQPELDASTGWTVGANWSIAAGKATHTGGAVQALAVLTADMVGGAYTANKPYIGIITVSNVNASNSVTIDCGTGMDDLTITTAGTYTFAVKSDGIGISIAPTSGFTGSVDYLSLKPVLGMVLDTAITTTNSHDTTCVVTLEER